MNLLIYLLDLNQSINHPVLLPSPFPFPFHLFHLFSPSMSSISHFLTFVSSSVMFLVVDNDDDDDDNGVSHVGMELIATHPIPFIFSTQRY